MAADSVDESPDSSGCKIVNCHQLGLGRAGGFFGNDIRGLMMVLRRFFFLLLSAILPLAGCEAERDVDKSQLEAMAGGELKETVPVSGTVSIKGSPAAGVNLYAYTQESGREPAAQARTKADGTYCWTTYGLCDGLPQGEYHLAFSHIPDEGKGKKAGEDMLDGKYRNPTKNDFTLTVKNGEPQTDVNYDLE